MMDLLHVYDFLGSQGKELRLFPINQKFIKLRSVANTVTILCWVSTSDTRNAGVWLGFCQVHCVAGMAGKNGFRAFNSVSHSNTQHTHKIQHHKQNQTATNFNEWFDCWIDKLPKNVALGELYAKYSLFDAHAGNSCCFIAPPSAPSSSSRFHGNCVSVTVGVVTRVSPALIMSIKLWMNWKKNGSLSRKINIYLRNLLTVFYCRYRDLQYCPRWFLRLSN